MRHLRSANPIAHHAIRPIFLTGLAALCAVGFARADVERELLLKKAVQLRDAIIIADSGSATSDGCFIGTDGLAVFNILTFAGPEVPKQFLLADKTRLKPPILRYVSSEFGIAIADFDYRPSVVIEPSSEPIPLELRVAILDRLSDNPAVAIGPVMSRVKNVMASYARPTCHRGVSIAAGLPAGRQWPPVAGAPLIDSTGKLRGTFQSTRHLGSQTLLNATDTSLWFAEIAKARGSKVSIPYPLPGELNPLDPSAHHPGCVQAVQALHESRYAAANDHVQAALRDHPESPLLQSLRFNIAKMGGAGDLLALAEATKPPVEGAVAEQVSYLSRIAWARSQAGDQDGAGTAFLNAVKLAPENHPGIRYDYARWLWRISEEPERALPYLRQAAEESPENIQLLGDLQKLLGQLNMWDEADKVSDRILELEELYKPTTSASLRPERK